MYSDLSRYTNQIYFIYRSKQGSLDEQHLLTEEQKTKAIDIF